ncbi:MAG: quinon protein alcohol dehydrogenase-like superfamily [Linnemannia elongata]|nr:MAG: quinon protein alcohol dehydrogenase-like superfamily [Linnemannia elongata]
MSPSLPPPPRKLSSSSASGNSAPRSPRYPKINPNSLAFSDPHHAQAEDDQDLDRALAELLGQSSLATNDDHHTPHLPQCKYYTNNPDNYYNSNHTTSSGRPLSITSLSSLGSGSFASYGSHSRRVSQAFLSPLSPPLSEPSSSGHNPFFNTVPESDECHLSSKQQTQDSIGSDAISQGNTTGMTTIEQDMGMVSSSMPSCTYCSSVRSNSICSSGTTDDKLASPTALHAAQPIHASSSTTSTKKKNRNSLQMAFDTNRLAALKEFIPSEVRLRLSYHLDECWFVEFSPDGKWMASTGLDQSVIIWQDVLSLEPTVWKTVRYTRSITHAHWSPDSKHLLVNLGFDPITPTYTPEMSVIDVATGETILTRKHHNGTRDIHALAVGWMDDSQHFVSAPSNGEIYIWNLKGEIIREMEIDSEVVDKESNVVVEAMIMARGQNTAIVADSQYKIRVIDLETGECRFLDRMVTVPSAMTLSRDGQYLAIAMRGADEVCRVAQILIYNFKTLTFLRALEADTYLNAKFVIRPSFCGPHNEILAAGSENGMVHFWDLETGEMIMTREEHSKHCGWTDMHAHLPGLMATCSDDNHIILWTTKDLSRTLQDQDDKWVESSRKKSIGQLPLNLKKGW